MHGYALRALLPVAAVLAATAFFAQTGRLAQPDDWITAERQRMLTRQASGTLAFVAIDKASLDAVGVWPWPRAIHAEILRRLVEADAAEIALDIDFSAASTPEGDAALAQALDEAGGGVILAAFLQRLSAAPDERRLGANLPLPAFREAAWLGTVNVVADPDGRVRRFPFAERIEDEEVPSIPALLAGRLGQAGTSFTIDFAIDPASVPTFSAIDLLEGRVGAEELAGRSVVVGAQAVELHDAFPVPVHGFTPGPLLQILAAETLIQDRALDRADGLALTALLLALLAALGRRPRLRARLGFLAAAGLTVELSALLLQARLPILLPTAGVHLAFFGTGLVLVARQLDLSNWLLRLARIEAGNAQRVLARIVADSSDAIVVVGEDGAVLDVSRRALELFAPGAAAPPARIADLVPAPMVADCAASIAALRAGGDWPADLRALALPDRQRVLEYGVVPSRLTSATLRWRPDAEFFVTCITARDITLKREQEARLDRLARFDSLTGAMRRDEFLARLAPLLDAPGAEARAHAVYVLNLHRFKTINLALGRKVGDAVLRSMTGRLAALDPRLDLLARLHGDTFALATATAVTAEEAAAIGATLLDGVAAPLALEDATARVGARIGLAIAEPGEAPEVLLDRAEIALDEARKAPGDAIASFQPGSAERQDRARRLERELWNALDRNELFLLYQPQVAHRDRRLVGAEALVRWRHPEFGLIPPSDFIGLAEATGFIEPLGRFVLEQACRDAALWPEHLTVSVNVSPVQFARGDLLVDIRRAAAAAGLPPARLQLEITESLFVEQSGPLLETIADLRMLGFGLALDDFGSGYSSFGYLPRLPLDKIKLDRLFLQDIETNLANQAIVRAVRAIAADLGMKLLCEGVETEGQLDCLKTLGVAEGQGYLFGRPESAEDFAARIRRAA